MVWIDPLTDQDVVFGAQFRFDVKATAIMPYWWLSDSTNFLINQQGIITNATILSIRSYPLQVYDNDTFGTVLIDSCIITVTEYAVHGPIVINGNDVPPAILNDSAMTL